MSQSSLDVRLFFVVADDRLWILTYRSVTEFIPRPHGSVYLVDCKLKIKQRRQTSTDLRFFQTTVRYTEREKSNDHSEILIGPVGTIECQELHPGILFGQ